MKSNLSFNKFISASLLIILIFSCKSPKEVVYYQNIDKLLPVEKQNSFEIKIQPDDLLLIIVSAQDNESVNPFNLSSAVVPMQNGVNQLMQNGQATLQTYLVDAFGNIDFPVLGKLKVSELSRTEIIKMLETKLATYIKNPIINLRVTNFKVSVQGEVLNPGTFNVHSDRITVLEAISMARDLTVYGRRNNVLIIRERDGIKSFNRIDLTKADFINSPFYYLAQNDVVYIEPNKVKINSAAVGPNTSVMISITSILITLVTLLVR